MFASIQYDVGGALVAAGGALIALTLIIAFLESIVMFLLKWDKFGRCLWVSFLMNVISTIFGGVLVVSDVLLDTYIALAVTFVLSVLIEGGVMLLMKRGAARQNWIASLFANLVSYLFIIVPFFMWLEA